MSDQGPSTNGRVDTTGAGPSSPKVAVGPNPAGSGKGAAVSFLNGKSAAAVFFALAYWVTVYCLPEPNSPMPPSGLYWVFIGIAVFALTLSGLAVGRRAIGRLDAVCLVAYVLLLDWLLFSAFYGLVKYDTSLKFTMAIGGVALVSFIVGIIVFDTLRVAASLPIVILFIGIASDPAGFTAGADIRGQLVIWMGGVLGLSTVAEGLTQWSKIRGDANVKTAVAAAIPGNPGMAAQTNLALAPANVGGDLSPAMGVPTAKV